MRPRPGGRGEPPAAEPRRRGDVELQCGHDPEAVESTVSGCGVAQRAAALQCGHDPEAVESPHVPRRAKPCCCLLQCGHDPEAVENPPRPPAVCGLGSASMRPRPGGRGERRPYAASAVAARLQCGHDPEAVESGTIGQGRVSTAAIQLQCGHDPEAVESPADRPWLDRSAAASMRPRPGGRGERHGASALTQTAAGFNAATTRRPWRAAERGRRADRTWWSLQCGHDPEAVENAGL